MTNSRTSPAHTAAPWTIEDESASHDVDVYLELKGDSGSKPLAHLYTMFEADEDDYETAEYCERDIAEYQANACLIAAAPDLLAAVLHYLEADTPLKRAAAHKAAHAALAKAEGR